MEIQDFIKSNPAIFKQCNPEIEHSSWHNIFENGNKIGYIWFKNILGGWGIKLYAKADSERIPVNNLEELKTILQLHGKPTTGTP